MAIWVRRMPAAAALAAAVICPVAWAQGLALPPKPGPPLAGLDGNSQLGNFKSTPIADPKGDAAAAGKVKIEEPPRPPVDPKVLR